MRPTSAHRETPRVRYGRAGDKAGHRAPVMRCVLWFDGSGPDANSRAYSNCAQLTPLHSADVTLGYERGDDDIVIAVTPRRVGTVRISGVEVHYSSGLRHATLHTGAQLNVTSRPAG